MAESQTELDAVVAAVSALASEAVEEIAAVAEPPGTGVRTAAAPDAAATRDSSESTSQTHNLQRVLHLEVPVIVRLAERSMPLSEILNLTSGAIIEFDKSAEGELDLLINNKCIGHGMAVKVGENFGLRVTRIGSVQDRIKALGT